MTLHGITTATLLSAALFATASFATSCNVEHWYGKESAKANCQLYVTGKKGRPLSGSDLTYSVKSEDECLTKKSEFDSQLIKKFCPAQATERTTASVNLKK